MFMSKRLHTTTTINGRLVKRGDDKISVFDNSLLYAEGLFETFLAVGDNIIFLDDHLKRLYKGARVLGLKIPVDKNRLSNWMKRTVSEHPDRITKLRMTLTSGEAARWVGISGKQQVILSASPHTMATKPFKLHVSEFKVDQDSIFRRIKTISYAIHAAALKKAKKLKYDDAILLNEKGNVAEVTSANIFWVEKGKIFTPPLGAGCLEGITRIKVINEARKIGIAVAEQNISLKKLLKADEIFISSSLKLVAPVSRIKNEKTVYKFNAGPITGSLQKYFLQLIGL